jgi:hypothetical protein
MIAVIATGDVMMPSKITDEALWYNIRFQLDDMKLYANGVPYISFPKIVVDKDLLKGIYWMVLQRRKTCKVPYTMYAVKMLQWVEVPFVVDYTKRSFVGSYRYYGSKGVIVVAPTPEQLDRLDNMIHGRKERDFRANTAKKWGVELPEVKERKRVDAVKDKIRAANQPFDQKQVLVERYVDKEASESQERLDALVSELGEEYVKSRLKAAARVGRSLTTHLQKSTT